MAVTSREPVESYDLSPAPETLEARLAAVERAYETLLERVRRYERERADIRIRLERIISRIGS